MVERIRKVNRIDNVIIATTTNQNDHHIVEFCKKNIVNGYANALIVNAGIANSFTGKKGTENNRRIANYFSKLINSRQKDIYICSTGVIGEQLPVPKIKKALKKKNVKIISTGGTFKAIKKIKVTPTKLGPQLEVELHDKVAVLRVLAKAAGLLEQQEDMDRPSVVGIVMQGPEQAKPIIDIEEDDGKSKV